MPGSVDCVVHSVQHADEGALAAARRADERRHAAFGDVHRDVEQGLLIPVEEVQVLHGYFDVEDFGRSFTGFAGQGALCVYFYH